MLQHGQVRSLYSNKLEEFQCVGGTVLIKTHTHLTDDVAQWIARESIPVVTTYRNAIEAAASRRNVGWDSRFGDKSFLQSFLETLSAIEAFKSWMKVANINICFPSILSRPWMTLKLLASALNIQCDICEVAIQLQSELGILEWSPGKKFQGVLPYWESAIPDWFRQMTNA